MTGEIVHRVETAFQNKTRLCIVGNSSKAFYGRVIAGERLDMSGHCGIVSYEPTELVMTARAGTPLEELDNALARQGQMLAFEPPYFGPGATLGGTIACGFSGPRRAYAGSARDFVLGVRIVNGRGELLRFGGEVMKNVAGYDVSRLMSGALGTLGVLLEISLKVLPRPVCETTRVFELTPAQAIVQMNQWAGKPLPLSATAYHDDRLYVRFSGADSAVASATARLGGEKLDRGSEFWRGWREQQQPFFKATDTLWRLSVPPAAPPLVVPGDCAMEWGGALRWLASAESAQSIQAAAKSVGGSATLFRGPLAARNAIDAIPVELIAAHKRIKHAFDPGNILNVGKLHPDV